MSGGPIIIDRHTGKRINNPQYTQEQIDYAWEVVIRAWAEKHKDVLASEKSLREFLDGMNKQEEQD